MNRRAARPEKSHIYVGRTEVKALVVGLATGALYGALQLPIPAPNVLGGNLAILFTFIGLVVVGLLRREVAFGKPREDKEITDEEVR